MREMLNWLRKRLANWAIKYLCDQEGHNWIDEGGRGCPYDSNVINCSQPVYKCGRCGTYDYGEEGGPGWLICKTCDKHPGTTTIMTIPERC